MDTIIFLLGAFVACVFLWCRWKIEHERCKSLRTKADCVEAENFRRQLAEWKYNRLKEAIEAECMGAPKTLAAIRLRVKWIENPPPGSFRPLPKKKSGRK